MVKQWNWMRVNVIFFFGKTRKTTSLLLMSARDSLVLKPTDTEIVPCGSWVIGRLHCQVLSCMTVGHTAGLFLYWVSLDQRKVNWCRILSAGSIFLTSADRCETGKVFGKKETSAVFSSSSASSNQSNKKKQKKLALTEHLSRVLPDVSDQGAVRY